MYKLIKSFICSLYIKLLVRIYVTVVNDSYQEINMENNTKGTIKRMTETQRKLAEENYGLIGGFCNLYNLNSDDYSDILSK